MLNPDETDGKKKKVSSNLIYVHCGQVIVHRLCLFLPYKYSKYVTLRKYLKK